MAKKLSNGSHPLAEVFGFPTRNLNKEASLHRQNKLCPFNNTSEKCTKSRVVNPLGVCSIYYQDTPTVICPVRFRENWRFCKDAAEFFFPEANHWSFVKEIRIKEKSGKSAGNIDVVVIAHDKNGKILDFGAIEVQAVYISGNIQKPFEYYMQDPVGRADFDWTAEKNYPRPDFLSSSRKRLVPQLAYKGKILRAWNKKLAVVIDRPFFDSLPDLPRARSKKGEICWLVYQLIGQRTMKYTLELEDKVITGFNETINTLDTPEIGESDEFVKQLEEKLAIELTKLRGAGYLSFSDFLKKQIFIRDPEASL